MATVLLSGAVSAGGGTADVTALAGSDLQMNASSSTDADGDVLIFNWSLLTKPEGSNVAIGNDSTPQITIRADVGGDYVVRLRVSDPKGAFTQKDVKINVKPNSAPVTNVVVTATFTGQSSVRPTQATSIGSAVLLDAAGSTDADGDAVTVSWALLEKPAASVAVLVSDARTTRFSTDVAGTYKVRARGTDAKGAWSETVYVMDAQNHAPQTVVLTSIDPGSEPGQSTITASTDYMIALDGTGSTDLDGDTLVYEWALVSKPAGSTATLSSLTGAASQITPDLKGSYVVKMSVADGKGASNSFLTTISVTNRRPVAVIGSNAVPVALPSGPALRMPVGTLMTLRGTASTDGDGDTLVYAWSLSSKPAGSSAQLSAAATSTVQLTPDASGSYVVVLRVTDSTGAYSERSLIIESGNYAPVAVIDKNRVSVLAGGAVSASAALSYDEDGDVLTYQWTLDAIPSGSSAALVSSNTKTLAFTPDLPGVYMATVTVGDGKSSSVASVYVKAMSSVTSNVSLNFVPQQSRYSKGLDKLIVISANPNALKIVDPFTGVIKTVVLPLAVKSLQLSPDGKLAAVLHENVVSLVDLEAAVLIRSSQTGNAHTDAFVTNPGRVYLIGQSGGQWTQQSVTVVDGRSGVDLTASLGFDEYGVGRFYGTQYGVYAPLKNRVLCMSLGLSPADIDFFTIDPASGKVTGGGESPYHGDYPMSTPLFLSGNEDLLFTSSGNYFYTETLRYAGALSVTGGVMSMSHASDADELLVMQSTYTYYGDPVNYKSSYLRFSGALFVPDAAIALPLINSEQSYGINIFHSANGSHVALVQTATAAMNGTGAKYFIATR